MPSLFDTLGQTQSSQIGSSPFQKKRTLAGKMSELGMPTQPTSPMQAATSGGIVNPDQAKMVGSSAQQNAANSPTAYSEAQQYTQPVAPVDPEAKRKAEEAKWWSDKAGSLGDRVSASIGTTASANIAGANAAPAVSTSAKTVITDPAELASLQSGLSAIQASNSLSPTPETLGVDQTAFDKMTETEKAAALVTAKENATNTAMQSIDAILAKHPGVTYENLTEFANPEDRDAYASVIAKLVPDQIHVSNVQDFANNDELAKNLGIDIATLNGMTVQQLQSAMNAKMQSGFSEGDKLTSMLNDSTLSASDRAAARGRLNELGITGVQFTEQEVSDARAAVGAADNITINGQTYTLEQLLSDDNIKKQVSDAINDDGSLNQDVLKNLPPELAKAITDNATALATLRNDELVKSGAWANLKTGYQTVLDNFGGALTDEMKTAFGITAQPLTAAGLTALNNNAYVKLFKSVANPVERGLLLKSLTGTDFLGLSGTTRATIAGLDTTTLRNMGAFGDKAADVWANSVQYLKMSDKINDPTYAGDILTDLGVLGDTDRASGVTNTQQWLDRENKDLAINRFMGSGNSGTITKFDINGDGKIDASELKTMLSNPTNIATLNGQAIVGADVNQVGIPAETQGLLRDVLDLGLPLTKENIINTADTPEEIMALKGTPGKDAQGNSFVDMANASGENYLKQVVFGPALDAYDTYTGATGIMTSPPPIRPTRPPEPEALFYHTHSAYNAAHLAWVNQIKDQDREYRGVLAPYNKSQADKAVAVKQAKATLQEALNRVKSQDTQYVGFPHTTETFQDIFARLSAGVK